MKCGSNVLHANTHQLTQMAVRFDFTLSRWRPWHHVMQQSAGTWWVIIERPPAHMQQRPSAPDL